MRNYNINYIEMLITGMNPWHVCIGEYRLKTYPMFADLRVIRPFARLPNTRN